MVDYEIRLGRADGGLTCLFIVAQWSDAAAIALGRAVKRHSDARLEIWRGDVRVHYESGRKDSSDFPRLARAYRSQPEEHGLTVFDRAVAAQSQ